MANIQIPQQGQPIDYNYVYQLVSTVNDLSTQISTKFSNSKIGSSKNNVAETKRLNDLSIAAHYQVVANSVEVKTNTEKSFTQVFGINYKYPPIVTVTPQVLSGTAGRDVSVVISSVTESEVSGYIAFNAEGTTSIAINVIAIGIPNN